MKCTFVDVAPDSDFSIHNLPYGIFTTASLPNRQVGVAIGNHVLCMSALAKTGLFSEINGLDTSVFDSPQLNEYMSLNRTIWRSVRQSLQQFLCDDTHTVRKQINVDDVAVPIKEVRMHMPAKIGDYTDFYASREHATNVGVMFRGKDNALMPNWTHLPVGYHGRASSVVVSGTPLRRPNGQRRPNPDSPPVFGPSTRLDYELEMAFFVGPGNSLGTPLSVDEAEDRIFGVVLMNDWSARDIQAWEYVPLGPFLGKSFGTTVSPWVVTMDALEPFRVMQPEQDPEPLPYLRCSSADKRGGFDINLNVHIKPYESNEYFALTRSNLKYMYWSLRQQLAHHTVNGCNMRPGDLCGTGTISGLTEESFGSMLELSWSGKNPIKLGSSEISRTFVEDNDTVRLTGYCQGEGYRVGFGECTGTILPAVDLGL
ncbi:hypothetical protein IW139_000825 [Coemansia sp. RSA 353]|nr:hypothetical protein GGH17_000697 [Coemansia sp. RSA 788]KAJ2146673.1 hypothetical protein J3F82_004889 [Coemansia sp. RSA 637]KAJ2149472.1 hypothetical protein IW142_000111 [Coemansia sp. RSA 564]KAJ2167991.1 hypothetical protein GGH15_001737 [Coemansia sp. RSA 562]KAJ2176011.1 hypothetical protein GGH16_000383 [Coemansia sp. RSA 560]KAJ2190633.1 hypothetical protein EV181_000902 [Coemansia sp. RSA 532]KAJ2199141.1 hypothetical protein GGH18_000687 [Coemansia sp. RSA 530]KAJ2200305.1 hyp